MQKTQNLQDMFLNQARRERVVVCVGSDGRQQMIYKHAISTIAPARNLALTEEPI